MAKAKKWKPEGERFYTFGERQVPSVTTVLRILDKPALIQWSANCAVEYMERYSDEFATANDERKAQILKSAKSAHRTAGRTAMDVGTMVHEAIEVYLAGGEPLELLKDNAQALMSFQAFLDFEAAHGFKPMHLERVVSDLTLGYAGRVDFIGHVDGVLSLVDFKSSKAIYDEMWFQTCSYKHAFECETGNVIERVGILRLDKETGVPEYVVMDAGPRTVAAFDMFRACLRTWQARQEWEAVNND